MIRHRSSVLALVLASPTLWLSLWPKLWLSLSPRDRHADVSILNRGRFLGNSIPQGSQGFQAGVSGSRRHLVHPVDQKRDGVGIRRFLDSVAEIEDVAGCRSSVLQDSIDLTTELFPWCE